MRAAETACENRPGKYTPRHLREEPDVSFPKLAGLYAICAVVFFAVDLVWLSVATKRLYRPYIGGLAYATYDLTNLATLRGWAWQVTAIDLVWGTTVTSVVAVAGYYAGRWLGIG